MSFLSSLFGRRTAPPPAPPADTLVLTGAGLDGAAGPVSLTVAVGERTFTAKATRKGLGDGFPAEYALHGFEQLVPEPEPQPKGELLTTVMAYEQGEFPAAGGELAGAYGEALEWAGDAARAAN